MSRKIIDWFYLQSACLPIWFRWQLQYAMNARFYFEFRDDPQIEFSGWPWNYTARPSPNPGGRGG